MKEPHTRHQFPDDAAIMRHAIESARRGFGRVEPNPQVGAVIVDAQRRLIAEGIHEHFGGQHAEVNALQAAGDLAAGATLFVTLEPCCHHGKTGPCTEAVIAAGIRRVVIGARDPFPEVDGGGIHALEAAGIEVDTGLLNEAATALIAPFRKRVVTGLPWVHAKWAMSLDGKIATRTGHSQWISSQACREVVHELRGRMDAIIVGANTAIADDPQLTARPRGPRIAARVVVDTHARLPTDSQLARTANEVPVLLATTDIADVDAVARLEKIGVEVLRFPTSSESPSSESPSVDLAALFRELGRREMSHVLVEGGGHLLGSIFDAQLADELHVFMAPKLIGGENAVSPLAGIGRAEVPELHDLVNPEIRTFGSDVYIHGRFRDSSSDVTS